MSKITDKERLEIYEKKQQGETSKSLSKQYGIRRSEITYLISLIDKHGKEILRNGHKRMYSRELKEEMISKVFKEGNSIRGTALEYGLTSNSILCNWIRSYKGNGYVILEKKKGRRSMKKSTDEQNKPYEEMTDAEKIEYLEKRNRYLEAEAEYLKKLHAVVQARKAQQQKKK